MGRGGLSERGRSSTSRSEIRRARGHSSEEKCASTIRSANERADGSSTDKSDTILYGDHTRQTSRPLPIINERPTDCDHCDDLANELLDDLADEVMTATGMDWDRDRSRIYEVARDRLLAEVLPRCPEHRRVCPDGGTCHHRCSDTECFRVSNCGPFSEYGEEWRPEDIEAFGEHKQAVI